MDKWTIETAGNLITLRPGAPALPVLRAALGRQGFRWIPRVGWTGPAEAHHRALEALARFRLTVSAK